MSLPSSSILDGTEEENICCICMEARTNLILACTHNYCEKCIKEWQVTSNTCPICRCAAGKNDGFILADKPDYYHMQDEMSKSLFQIAESGEHQYRNSKGELVEKSDDDDEDSD